MDLDNRPVTEFDLRSPQFKHPDVKPEHFEWRHDGVLVRKDRFVTAIHSVADHLAMRRGWEIEDVLRELEIRCADARRFMILVSAAKFKSGFDGEEVVLRIYDPREKEGDDGTALRFIVEANAVSDGTMVGNDFREAVDVLGRELEKKINDVDDDIPF